MPPTVIRMPVSSATSPHFHTQNNGGIQICCCRMFTCVNLGFLTSPHGLLKISEVVLGTCCQTLLIRFGLSSAEDIGPAFNGFLTTSSSCLMTASLLLFCYVISTRTFQLVRQSLFEIFFNLVACFFYWSASSYMTIIVTFWLYPTFELQRGYMAYPAMTAVYYIGFIVGLVHAVDAYTAYKYYKGYR